MTIKATFFFSENNGNCILGQAFWLISRYLVPKTICKCVVRHYKIKERVIKDKYHCTVNSGVHLMHTAEHIELLMAKLYDDKTVKLIKYYNMCHNLAKD